MKKHFVFYFFLVLIIFLCFSGCSSTSPLYSWGNYEAQVYAYLNGTSPLNSINTMERDLQRIEAGGRRVPPGFYAHLGMLHAEVGSHDTAVAYFNKEKASFPESAVFMDFFLRRYGR